MPCAGPVEVGNRRLSTLIQQHDGRLQMPPQQILGLELSDWVLLLLHDARDPVAPDPHAFPAQALLAPERASLISL